MRTSISHVALLSTAGNEWQGKTLRASAQLSSCWQPERQLDFSSTRATHATGQSYTSNSRPPRRPAVNIRANALMSHEHAAPLREQASLPCEPVMTTAINIKDHLAPTVAMPTNTHALTHADTQQVNRETFSRQRQFAREVRQENSSENSIHKISDAVPQTAAPLQIPDDTSAYSSDDESPTVDLSLFQLPYDQLQQYDLTGDATQCASPGETPTNGSSPRNTPEATSHRRFKPPTLPTADPPQRRVPATAPLAKLRMPTRQPPGNLTARNPENSQSVTRITNFFEINQTPKRHDKTSKRVQNQQTTQTSLRQTSLSSFLTASTKTPSSQTRSLIAEQTIRMATINVQGNLDAHLPNIIKLFEKQNIDLLAIIDHGRKADSLRHLQLPAHKFAHHWTPAQPDEQDEMLHQVMYLGGVGIITRPHLEAYRIGTIKSIASRTLQITYALPRKQTLSVTAIYGPTGKEHLTHALLRQIPMPESEHSVILGDLNLTVDEAVDAWRDHTPQRTYATQNRATQELMAERHLHDTFREIHGNKARAYTYTWAQEGKITRRRIDHIWVSANLANHILDANVITEHNVGDHALVWADIQCIPAFTSKTSLQWSPSRDDACQRQLTPPGKNSTETYWQQSPVKNPSYMHLRMPQIRCTRQKRYHN